MTEPAGPPGPAGLDHYKIEFFYSKVCTLAVDVAYDLRHAVAPHVFDRVEAHLLAHNFNFSATTADIFVQRLQVFAISNVRIVPYQGQGKNTRTLECLAAGVPRLPLALHGLGASPHPPLP